MDKHALYYAQIHISLGGLGELNEEGEGESDID